VFCLKVASDPAWVEEARRDLDAILVDHAHCEMKAASNALSLATRPPGDFVLVRALTDLAREEIDHFQRVVDFLERRGLRLGTPPVDAYASDLRRAVSALPRDAKISTLTDRLLVAALIEARSCERFKLLLPLLAEQGDAELLAFYKELFAAEARHYQVLVDLAIAAADGDAPAVHARLERVAEREAAIVRALAKGDARGSIHG
jgi:tRNA 2-(methylsulfanyl)-N6-isopentenyladenosine37 hydroxylase